MFQEVVLNILLVASEIYLHISKKVYINTIICDFPTFKVSNFLYVPLKDKTLCL